MKNVHVKFKFPGTRKERDMVVYPSNAQNNNRIIIQGDDVIAEFDATTGKGVYNIVKCHPGFVVLHPAMHPKTITFPMDFVKQCIQHEPHSGDEVAKGLRIA